jgi:hypothetical protein
MYKYLLDYTKKAREEPKDAKRSQTKNPEQVLYSFFIFKILIFFKVT